MCSCIFFFFDYIITNSINKMSPMHTQHGGASRRRTAHSAAAGGKRRSARAATGGKRRSRAAAAGGKRRSAHRAAAYY